MENYYQHNTIMCVFLCFYTVVHNEVQQQPQRSNGDGTLSPTSNQLARWFSPELLAQGTQIFISVLFSDRNECSVLLNETILFFFFCFSINCSLCWQATIVGCHTSPKFGGI